MQRISSYFLFLIFPWMLFAESSLEKLENEIQSQLQMLSTGKMEWRTEKNVEGRPLHDVIIVGGGAAGLSASLSLRLHGITDVKIFDLRPEGQEGPWMTTARMKTLRSAKGLMGPALDIPQLTFHSWYVAKYGEDAWQQLTKSTRRDWMDYLIWYRHVLNLPVENNCRVLSILPVGEHFHLKVQRSGHLEDVFTRKVVLATGRGGFGGEALPAFVQNLPKEVWAHTEEWIDCHQLEGKDVVIVGVGASSIDAAASALEAGASTVTMLMRRHDIPKINKFSSLLFPGFEHAFFFMPDIVKAEWLEYCFEKGIPPPKASVKRVEAFNKAQLLSGRDIEKIEMLDAKVAIFTNQERLLADYLILGTGFGVDGRKQAELKAVFDDILLWKDKLPQSLLTANPKLGRFPYLGFHFQFMEKPGRNAPYLKNLHCFNYGAYLSHGMISGDIPAISIGARRLAEGIVRDLFLQDIDDYHRDLLDYDLSEYEKDEIILQRNF